jgi:hypothetical protein
LSFCSALIQSGNKYPLGGFGDGCGQNIAKAGSFTAWGLQFAMFLILNGKKYQFS